MGGGGEATEYDANALLASQKQPLYCLGLYVLSPCQLYQFMILFSVQSAQAVVDCGREEGEFTLHNSTQKGYFSPCMVVSVCIHNVYWETETAIN